MIWAAASTALNYFAGIGLALLLEKDCVKGKAFWRAFPVLSYAIPGFITLLAFKFMFSYGGPVNQLIIAGGGSAIGFLDLDAKWSARLIGLFVNCWISVPSMTGKKKISNCFQMTPSVIAFFSIVFSPTFFFLSYISYIILISIAHFYLYFDHSFLRCQEGYCHQNSIPQSLLLFMLQQL